MKITGIEVTELRMPGWNAQSLNPETVQRYRVPSDRSARHGNGHG